MNFKKRTAKGRSLGYLALVGSLALSGSLYFLLSASRASGAGGGGGNGGGGSPTCPGYFGGCFQVCGSTSSYTYVTVRGPSGFTETVTPGAGGVWESQLTYAAGSTVYVQGTRQSGSQQGSTFSGVDSETVPLYTSTVRTGAFPPPLPSGTIQCAYLGTVP